MSEVCFAPHVIIESQDNSGFSSVYAADLDGDADMDVLVVHSWREIDELGGETNRGTLIWYENTTNGDDFVERQTVSTEVAVYWSLSTADVDGDDDIDILFTSDRDGTLAWYENTDGEGHFGSRNIIDTMVSAYGGRGTSVADVDGDGDMDVVLANLSGNIIGWYENTDGRGSFGPRTVIARVPPGPLGGEGPQGVRAADIDGDGDVDVLSSVSSGDRITWYENVDGRGDFGPANPIATTDDPSRRWLDAVDLDGDTDVDILLANIGTEGLIAWYENIDGNGNFGPQKIIATGLRRAFSVYATDIDGDGDVDVLATSEDDNIQITSYENVSPEPGDANCDLRFDEKDVAQVLEAAKYSTAQPATWEEGDWNGDGVFDQFDIVAGLQTGHYLQGPYTAFAADVVFAAIGA